MGSDATSRAAANQGTAHAPSVGSLSARCGIARRIPSEGAAVTSYLNLLSPLEAGSLTVRNRIVPTPYVYEGELERWEEATVAWPRPACGIALVCNGARARYVTAPTATPTTTLSHESGTA